MLITSIRASRLLDLRADGVCRLVQVACDTARARLLFFLTLFLFGSDVPPTPLVLCSS
jgi:hypothetical protein